MKTNRLLARELWSLVRLGGPSASADGSVVVVPETTYDLESNEGTTRLCRILDGRPHAMTHGASASAPMVSPDGSALAFLRKVEGASQLHVLPLGGGEARVVTDFPLGVVAAAWRPGGGWVVVTPLCRDAPTVQGTRLSLEVDTHVTARTTQARVYRFWDGWLTDGRAHHVFVVSPEGEARHVSRGLDALLSLAPADPSAQLDVSPDGSKAVVSAAAINEDDARLRYGLYLLDLDGEAEARPLTAGHPASDVAPRFVDDDRVLFGARRVADDYSDPPLLTLLDLRDGKERTLTKEWAITPSEWIVVGERALVVAEERGRAQVYSLDLADGALTLVAGGATFGALAWAGDSLLTLKQSISRPPELVSIGRDGRETALYDPNAARLAEVSLGDVEEMEFEGAEGDSVQMWVVYPPDFDPALRWPLVHMIHGGPHATFGDVLHWRWCAHTFAAPGYVVALVNFHGSTSFGHEFTRSIQGTWGDFTTQDVLAATDALVARGFIDPERMAITGGSFGGYMAAWIPTQTNRFRCAIAHAAVTNLGGMMGTDSTWGLARAYGADPLVDPETVNRWNPAHHYAAHETPTLVIHGERDFRVPVSQGLELYGALKSKGVAARLVYYPDENHWILSPANSIHWYGEIHAWLERFVGSPRAIEPTP